MPFIIKIINLCSSQLLISMKKVKHLINILITPTKSSHIYLFGILATDVFQFGYLHIWGQS